MNICFLFKIVFGWERSPWPEFFYYDFFTAGLSANKFVSSPEENAWTKL
ncbi:hypothetical protein [Leptospira santarosai]|nr:hypothetical protein [Leptospira santarosai]